MAQNIQHPGVFSSPDEWDAYNSEIDRVRLRDEFAKAVLPIVYPETQDINSIAKECYLMADAMLKAREG